MTVLQKSKLEVIESCYVTDREFSELPGNLKGSSVSSEIKLMKKKYLDKKIETLKKSKQVLELKNLVNKMKDALEVLEIEPTIQNRGLVSLKMKI